MPNVNGSAPDVNLLDAALKLAKSGFPVFPCNPETKAPFTPHGFHDATKDPKIIRAWWSERPWASIGLPTGDASGIVIVDFDSKNGAQGLATFAHWQAEFGAFTTKQVSTPSGGIHLYFKSRGLPVRCSQSVIGPGVDVRGNGGCVVAVPSEGYVTTNGRKIEELPAWLEKLLLDCERKRVQERKDTEPGQNKVELIKHPHRHPWLRKRSVQYASNGDNADTILEKLKMDYAKRCDKDGPIPDSKLRDLAESAVRKYRPPTESQPEGDRSDHEIRGSRCEDVSNGERFTAQHAGITRFCHGVNRWTLWTGTHWATDQERQAQELGKLTARSIFVEAARLETDREVRRMASWAEKSLSMKHVREMLEAAKSDPAIRCTMDLFDKNIYLLNFRNGTVDLRTGELGEHRKRDYITKIVACDYAADLVGPRWSKFIEETFGEMAPWIQKAVGYSLTGVTVEKVVFLLWGVTDTGKSTFLTVLRSVFEMYSTVLQIETLMQNFKGRQDNNVNADLANLRGVRLAITSETEQGQRLHETKLKRITQGMGTISATRKYENPIEFEETHKLWLDTNHLPRILGTDDAIWNRIIPIPVLKTPRVIDRGLKDKLLHEAEAVASWTVAGARRYFQEGLGLPQTILDLRNEYRRDQDTFGQFMEDELQQKPDARTSADLLYRRYLTWCEPNGVHHPLSRKYFGLALTDRGFNSKHTKTGVVYFGWEIKDDDFFGAG